MKIRGWLLMLLFAHVMLHPWVHAIGAGEAVSNHTSISDSASPTDHGVTAADQCELCRAGHNTALTPQLPRTDLLNPRWIHTTLQSVNYASLQADRRLPSRAPPIL